MATTPAVQPSPDGQGDALVEAAMIIANAAHDRALMSDILSGMRAHEAQSLKSAILALDAALAARQPVYVQGCDELRARTGGERAAYMEGLEEGKKIAARQPVGDCWSGWATQYPGAMPKLYGAREIAELNHHPEEGQRLIFLTEQPAQAVDLGQFRRPIEEWRSDMEQWVEGHGDYDGVFAKDIAEANRLLALIDSQAVG
ncbi:hypothetical protein [Stenotrophomonas pavanii]